MTIILNIFLLRNLRYRRPEEAPRMEVSAWVRVMARRIESQIARDWHFGFVSWNYWFRSTVNLSRTLYSYETAKTDDGKRMGSGDLQRGAIEIMKALFGKFQDASGRMQAVAGDMTKVRYVPGLSSAAKRLLQNIQHISRRLPGTQEIRRLMRFETHAFRIAYGVPIFVTFTPDESHNLLMLRFSRVRQNDPLFGNNGDKPAQDMSGLWCPKLSTDVPSRDDVIVGLPVEDILDALPSYDERRTILARDPLASVDGFRVLIQVTYLCLFGLRICPFCPDCNNSKHGVPCNDLFGSNALPEGGIFGRIDAGYTSIESQKSSGSLHAHSQLFVQCLHQHTPLVEVLAKVRADGKDLVSQYLDYKAHVSRQMYSDPIKAEERLPQREEEWPEYKDAKVLIAKPKYLTRRDPIDKDNEILENPGDLSIPREVLSAKPMDKASEPLENPRDVSIPRDTKSVKRKQQENPSGTSIPRKAMSAKPMDKDSEPMENPRDVSIPRATKSVKRKQQEEGWIALGKQWLKEHLDIHVQLLQEHKQHHVHIWNEDTGERMPLTHCQRKDNPKLCKADFPRLSFILTFVTSCTFSQARALGENF